jgi:hypothetical protein
MDNTKDFELWFVTEKSTKIENAPITKQKLDEQINGLSCGKSTNRAISSDEIDDMISELEDDCDGVTDRKDETLKIRLFNTVIHPEPINTIGVPLSINGELLVEANPVDVKVKNGTLELNGAKDRFKFLAGITDKEQFKCESNSQYNVELPENNSPIVIKNKNAYEVRLSLVEIATDIVKSTNYGQLQSGEMVGNVLLAARDLYAFVENKK